MNVTNLTSDLHQLLQDSEELERTKRQLEKTKLALTRSELQVSKLEEKVAKIRRKDSRMLDPNDEDNLFRSHTRFRFTSHINGVRALHVKTSRFGKMFTSRDNKGSLLAKAIEYLRETAWAEQSHNG